MHAARTSSDRRKMRRFDVCFQDSPPRAAHKKKPRGPARGAEIEQIVEISVPEAPYRPVRADRQNTHQRTSA
jgi:hypothetical protein